MSQPNTFDVVVLGGGAAGLMCAMRAGQRGRKVLLLDHAEKVGKKILISGGGRCNFTNLDARPEAFLSANPHFCKSALARYTQHDFIELVNRHRIAWHEKTLGQLFCDGSARQIVAMLLDECAAVGVDVRVAHKVTRVEKSDRFTVATDQAISPPRRSCWRRAACRSRRWARPASRTRWRVTSDCASRTRGRRWCRSRCPCREISGVAARRRGALRPRTLPRGAAVHPSRPVGPGDPAGFVLLEARSGDRGRPAARSRCGVAAEGAQADTPQGRAAHDPRGNPAAAAGAKPGDRRHHGGPARPRSRNAREPAQALDVRAGRHRGLRQGRSHAGRHRHRRALVEDDGGEEGPRPLRDRRGRRRHGLARRLQFPVGLVERLGGGRVV